MPNLTAGTYPDYFDRYINLVEADTVAEAIEKYSTSGIEFFRSLPEEKIMYRYAEGKWSIKEMLQHIIDTERIFAFRSLCIARKDKTPLPGFDENNYAAASNADSRDWQDLLEEFAAVRKSTDLLLKSFSEEQLNESGITNERPIVVKAFGFIIYGHIIHHSNIVKERYL